MTITRLLSIPLVSLAASACVQFTPYRTETLTEPPANYQPKIFACNVDQRQKPERSLCENPAGVDSHAIQERHYGVRFEDGKTETLDYYLAAVEFDDQGWFADRKQMEALFLLLKTLEETNNGHSLIYVFAHGWKHNASPCDNNVVCFSRLLERTDSAEMLMAGGDKKGKRTVVGVFVGWRGLPYEAGVLTNLSFWTRKEAAARVGRGGVFELLLRLRDYRDSRQTDTTRFDAGAKTQLVITGHSFGGLVVYSALSHALMERAAKTKKKPCGGVEYDVARSFGDFVMLVNPAFEGSLYEPLFNIATHRCYDKRRQRPVMMIVTSEADRATGIAFPAGRALSTLFEHANSSDQLRSMREAIGHDRRYQTHRLTPKGPAEDAPVDSKDCGCPYLTETFDWRIEKDLGENFFDAFLDAANKQRRSDAGNGKPVQLNSSNYGSEVELNPEPVPHYASSYPYLVVTTDAGVIADHNAIYNNRFINFAQLFFLHHIAWPEPQRLPGDTDQSCWIDDEAPRCTIGSQLPCMRSCQLTDGSPCSSVR